MFPIVSRLIQNAEDDQKEVVSAVEENHIKIPFLWKDIIYTANRANRMASLLYYFQYLSLTKSVELIQTFNW